MTVLATLSLDEAARQTWEVLVVGAGPAGAVAAHGLARRGLSTLLVDRAVFPRGKVCGCCLNRRALSVLETAGLGNLTHRCGASPLVGIELAVGRQTARVTLKGSVALSREAFDSALIEAAITEGVCFLPDTRAVLTEGETTPTRTLCLHQRKLQARIKARCVLAADGLGGTLLSRSGLATEAALGARIGAGVVVAGIPFYRPGIVYMVCGKGGYAGLVNLEDGRLDLAAAMDPSYVRISKGPAEAVSRLLEAVGWPVPPDLSTSSWRGTPPLTRQGRRLGAERLFLVGDAAGYVEPFTGEGIAWALASGAAVVPLAARAVHHWTGNLVPQWSVVHRQIVGHRLACRGAAAVLRRPLLAATLLSLLKHLPGLARPFVGHLNRMDPRL
jgi:flavin-dependent dehydrogenase